MEQPLTIEEFSDIMGSYLSGAPCGEGGVAVGLSGGPDSMALLRLLSLLREKSGGPAIHALTVDHGLRAESASEAAQVRAWVKDWPGVQHATLRWGGVAETRIQEEARAARYGLMAAYCREHGIRRLFLAHHQDDQAETVLFRLAKGSGLDGLAGMRSCQPHGEIILIRPFLDIPKARLLATCKTLGLSFVEDPSNGSERFARVRLRKSAEVLAEEGLTAKRLALTARRLGRVRDALDAVVKENIVNIILENNPKRVVLNNKLWQETPDEIAFRIILRVVGELRPGEDYAPRMEKIEDLFYDLRSPENFRRRTLGGLVFERKDKAGQIVIIPEPAQDIGA